MNRTTNDLLNKRSIKGAFSKENRGLIITVIIIFGILATSLIVVLLQRPRITGGTFISVWDTRNPGVSEINQIKLPLEKEGEYNFIVDWGDGTYNVITKGNQAERTHTYASEGVYTINITGNIDGWCFNNQGDRLKLLEIKQWGDLQLGNSGAYFMGCANLVITATDKLNMVGTTNLASTFRDCNALNVVKGINDWDMSDVIDMSHMFQRATVFNQDISNWDVSSVTDMSKMFYQADNFNQSIENWDVSSVIDFDSMFYRAINFNQNISIWDVSNVIDMKNMFKFATAFNQSIGVWDVSRVSDMSGIFNNATSFNHNISSWDVSNVIDMSKMFRNATSFNHNISNWDVSSVTDMSEMFYQADAFNQSIGVWNVSSVTDMNHMFTRVDVFNQDIGNWNISRVTDMTDMFKDVTLTTANYNNLLIGWESLTVLQNNVNFSAGNSKYTAGGAADTARQALIAAPNNWTITDGGSVP